MFSSGTPIIIDLIYSPQATQSPTNCVAVTAVRGWVKISLNGEVILNLAAADYKIDPVEAAKKLTSLFEGRTIRYKYNDGDAEFWADDHWIELGGGRGDLLPNDFIKAFNEGIARPMGLAIDVDRWWVSVRVNGRSIFSMSKGDADDVSINKLKAALDKRTFKYDNHKIFVDSQIILDYNVKDSRLYTVQEVVRKLEETFNLNSPAPSALPPASRLTFMPPPVSQGTDAVNANVSDTITLSPR